MYHLSEKGKFYDASILIDQDGEILGVQKMVHVAQAENSMSRIITRHLIPGFKFSTQVWAR